MGSDPDGRERCWPGVDAVYRRYHDEEWGRPVRDERGLYEKVVLEGFQSGLAWSTVLAKRPALREAFADFDPDRVARFGEAERRRLLSDARLIRNVRKVEAAITNARAVLDLRDEGSSLVELVWSFRPAPGPAPASWDDVPAHTDESAALAAELKRRGFVFVGPTTMYALMQATGQVNDHLAGCWVRDEVAREQAQAVGA